MTTRRPQLHSGAKVWLLIVVLSLLSVSSTATARQSSTDAITATATTGTVMLQPSGSDDAMQLGTDVKPSRQGDASQVGDEPMGRRWPTVRAFLGRRVLRREPGPRARSCPA